MPYFWNTDLRAGQFFQLALLLCSSNLLFNRSRAYLLFISILSSAVIWAIDATPETRQSFAQFSQRLLER